MTQTPPSQPTGPNASPIAGILKDVAVAAHSVRTKLGELTHGNRGRIDTAIQKATDVVNRQTKGQYSSTVAKVATIVRKGVDQVENQRTATPPAQAAPSAPQAGTAAPSASQTGPSTTATTPSGPAGSPGGQPASPSSTAKPEAGWRRDASGNWVRDEHPGV